jgi:hypothetical protein
MFYMYSFPENWMLWRGFILYLGTYAVHGGLLERGANPWTAEAQELGTPTSSWTTETWTEQNQ